MTNPFDQKTSSNESPISEKRLELARTFFRQLLDEGKSIFEIRGLTQQNIESLYLVAHTLYMEGRYQEACPLFQLMAFYDHYDKRAWMGAASCLEQLKDYKTAIRGYACASMLDPENPDPVYHSLNCFLELDDIPQSINALDVIISLVNHKKGFYEELKHKAESMKQALLRNAPQK